MSGTICTFTNATNRVDAVAHGRSNNDQIFFTNAGGDLPAELVESLNYFIINKTADNFQVSLSQGGAAVTISDDGTGENQFQFPYISGLTGAQIDASLASVNIVLKTTSGSYSKPSNLISVMVEVIGGGGGAGGVDGQGATNFAVTPGGGAGGYSKKLILSAALGASETVTIGAGGAGGAAGDNAGSAGGTTSFGTHLQATGGGFSDGKTASDSIRLLIGAAGGVGSSGDINTPGANGGTASGMGPGPDDTASGSGGNSVLSAGALAVSSDTSGITATGYGGGGSGASVSNIATNYAGGDGADGVCIITEFLKV